MRLTVLTGEHVAGTREAPSEHDRVADSEVGKYDDDLLLVAGIDVSPRFRVVRDDAAVGDRHSAAIGLFRVGLDDVHFLHTLDEREPLLARGAERPFIQDFYAQRLDIFNGLVRPKGGHGPGRERTAYCLRLRLRGRLGLRVHNG